MNFQGKKKDKKDKKPYPAYLIIMIITSSEQIHVTVHVGANMLIFNLVLTISSQVPESQPCSRADTEEIKYLNYNIKYLNYNLVCIFYQNYALNILSWGDGKRKKLHFAIRKSVS